MKHSTIQFISLIILVIGLGLLGHAIGIDLAAVKSWLEHYPLWLSGLFYIFIYVGLTTFFWFGTIDFFRITGALLFGPYMSSLFVFIAEVFNASILFVLSRKLGREFIEQKFHLKSSDTQYGRENAGFWTALALRVNPFVPFRFMDVGFGLSKLSFKKYVWVVILGSPLRIFWLQFCIAGVGEAILKKPMAMMDYLQNNRFAMQLSMLYMGLVLAVTVGAVVINVLRGKSRQTQG